MPQTALLLTIGTGSAANLEGSLFHPLLKSARDGKWSLIVLLPSQETRGHAETLKGLLNDRTVEIHPLPQVRDENAIDSCYRHFDAVIAELRQRGFSPAALTADFTRGTKAMSAALMLAAVRHGVAMTRYIEGDRDERGMVTPGRERVRGFAPEEALFGRRLDAARALFRGGSFAAVAAEMSPEIVAETSPEIRKRAAAIFRLAQFRLAWDRLDYAEASAMKPDAADLPADWQRFAPLKAVQDWIGILAEPAAPNGKAVRCEHLIADLLANAERRLAQGQYEDCLIRAYRILELLGQSRLFAVGFDSAAMLPDDSRVRTFVEALGANEMPARRGNGYSFGREQVARFLKSRGDTFGTALLKFAGTPTGQRIVQRNKSVLAHGFDAARAEDAGSLRAALRELESLFKTLAGSRAGAYLNLSRWADAAPDRGG